MKAAWHFSLVIPNVPAYAGLLFTNAIHCPWFLKTSLRTISSSHASPIPSLSKSFWSEFAINWHLSAPSGLPSLSSSWSHASPIVSPSVSVWSVYATRGQLSAPSSIVSLSSSWSHGSPWPSLSVSICPGFGTRGQLSFTSRISSLSVSVSRRLQFTTPEKVPLIVREEDSNLIRTGALFILHVPNRS